MLKDTAPNYFAGIYIVCGYTPKGLLPNMSRQQTLKVWMEQLLRVFLFNGVVPMDNNYAERAIRPFILGRKNWVNMDSIRGAQASAILYSLVETAKANNLWVYEYLEYLLDGLSRHADDTDREFLKDLLPWSEAAQKKCRSPKKS